MEWDGKGKSKEREKVKSRNLRELADGLLQRICPH